MFLLTMGPGTNLAFPDVCRTPSAPVPCPNVVRTCTSSSAAENVIVECAPALHQLSQGQISTGGVAGISKGIVSGEAAGRSFYLRGCSSILVDGAPAQRLTSVTAQNAAGGIFNAVGMCVAPSQSTVLTLG